MFHSYDLHKMEICYKTQNRRNTKHNFQFGNINSQYKRGAFQCGGIPFVHNILKVIVGPMKKKKNGKYEAGGVLGLISNVQKLRKKKKKRNQHINGPLGLMVDVADVYKAKKQKQRIYKSGKQKRR